MNGFRYLLLTAALASPVMAQDESALLSDDLAFAEDLARHRYFDMALQQVANTKVAIEESRDSELSGEASLTEARIYMRQADSTSDTDAQLASLTRAVELLEDWIRPGSPYAFHDRLVDAYEDIATARRDRGKLYARLVAEGIEGARDDAAADFRAADEAYENLYDECMARAEQIDSMELDAAGNPEYEGAWFSDSAKAMALRGNTTYYLRGLNAIEWAEVSDDREFRIETAIELLDEFTWEVSDEVLVYYAAMYEQARALAALGELEDAKDLADNLLELARPMFWEWEFEDGTTGGVGDLSGNAQNLISGMFSDVWGFLARFAAEHESIEAGQQWIDTLLAEHEAQGIAISRRGNQVLLEWVEALDALGQGGKATRIAKLVADKARGTPEGDRAEVLLASLVEGSFVESPDVLMSVAKGKASDGQQADAAFNFMRAAALSTSDADREQFAFDAWMGVGEALTKLRRYLEAAVAYTQALETAQALGRDGDDIERSAVKMYNSYDRRFKETQHPFDKDLRDTASQMLINMGVAGDLPFLQAQEAFSELQPGDIQGYLRVKADFEAVPTSSPNYEKALVYVARCLLGAEKIREADEAFTAVEARADDPALAPSSADSRVRREVAMAQARYYHVELLLSDEVADANRALDVLADFEDEVASQESFFPLVRYQRVRAYAMAGDVDAAEAALDVLIETGADDLYVANAAFRVAAALETEARAMQEAEGDPAQVRDLLRRAGDAMWMYNERSGFTRFVNLVTTGDWYLEAGEPAAAQRAYEKVREVFSGEESQSRLDDALIGLATAYDQQRDFGRSRQVWKDLLARKPRDTDVRRGAALSFGGWMILDDAGTSVVEEVAGSGDYQEAYDLWGELLKAANVNNKYTDIWWQAKLGTIYTNYRQREMDPAKLELARKFIDNLRLSTPEWDQSTYDTLDPESRYEPMYWPFFRYLDRQIPTN